MDFDILVSCSLMLAEERPKIREREYRQGLRQTGICLGV